MGTCVCNLPIDDGYLPVVSDVIACSEGRSPEQPDGQNFNNFNAAASQ